MIKIKGELIKPIGAWAGTLMKKHGVTETVTKTPRTVTEMRAASRKVGRPKKANALSAAHRARAYRARKAGQQDHEGMWDVLHAKTDEEWLAETVNADG